MNIETATANMDAFVAKHDKEISLRKSWATIKKELTLQTIPRGKPGKLPWWDRYNLDKTEFKDSLVRFLDAWFNELRCNRNYHARDIFTAAIDTVVSSGAMHRQLERYTVAPAEEEEKPHA